MCANCCFRLVLPKTAGTGIDFRGSQMTSHKPGKISLEVVGEEVPMGSMGKPEDIAKVALFLVSGLSAYITCQTINVDSGNVLS
ncbi:MAG: SDR family oxidoreductase [Rhodobacteraceae bacterium]|nr:SDR family oxidoreductase [Paracoccaceae bacterium]